MLPLLWFEYEMSSTSWCGKRLGPPLVVLFWEVVKTRRWGLVVGTNL
jgi:hypothetical protein